MFVAERSGAELPTRLGLTVPRAAGTAVARNRTKRRLREAMRECAPRAGFDVVIRADGTAVKANFQELVGHLSGALGDAGVLR